MGGTLGETVNQIVSDFNASQSEVKVTPVFKGGYEETLTADIAAFRAGAQPNIIQVFNAGSATITGAKGATVAVQDLWNNNGYTFNIKHYISGARYFYADAKGKMIGMPFNSSAPIMYDNKAALHKAGGASAQDLGSLCSQAQGRRLHPLDPIAHALDLCREIHLSPQFAVCHPRQRL